MTEEKERLAKKTHGNMTGNVNLEDAENFVRTITRGNGTFTYETFTENVPASHPLDEKDPGKKFLHGPFGTVVDWLVKLNEQGAGVFFVLNDIANLSRVNENVVNVRAILAKVDNASLKNVEESGLPPQIITEDSEGNYCCFWPVSDVRLEMFTPIQRATAKKFDADPCMTDLALLVRIPGFFNQKGEPFLSELIKCDDSGPYTVAQIIEGLDISQLLQCQECESLPVEIATVHDELQEDSVLMCVPQLPEPQTSDGPENEDQLKQSDSDPLSLDAEGATALALRPETFRTNEEYRDMFPPMDAETYRKTKDSIRRQGIQNPITITKDGTVIDGYHRSQIWKELTAEGTVLDLPYRVRSFETQEQLLEFLRVQNEYRRHLDVRKAAEAALKDLPKIEEEVKKARYAKSSQTLRGEKEPEEARKRATDIAGERHGVSGKTVERLQTVRESIHIDIKEAVDSGQMTINKGYDEIRKREADQKPRITKIDAKKPCATRSHKPPTPTLPPLLEEIQQRTVQQKINPYLSGLKIAKALYVRICIRGPYGTYKEMKASMAQHERDFLSGLSEMIRTNGSGRA